MTSLTDDRKMKLEALENHSLQLEPSPELFQQLCTEAISFCCDYLNESANDPKAKAWIDFNPVEYRLEALRAFSVIPEQARLFSSPSPLRCVGNESLVGDGVDCVDDDKIISNNLNTPSSVSSAKLFGAENLENIFSHLKDNVFHRGAICCSPNFFGDSAVGGGIPAAALGDMIAAIANRFSGFYPAQPGFALLETMLVKFLGKELGFFEHQIQQEKDDEEVEEERARGRNETRPQNQEKNTENPPNDTWQGGGYFASGASTATISCFAAARDKHKIFLGTEEYAKAVIYITREAHACLGQAIHIVGCGRVKVRFVPTYGDDDDDDNDNDNNDGHDDEGDYNALARYKAMNCGCLEKQMNEDVEVQGLRPWLVVASAGTVGVGALDQLDVIGGIAKSHGAWYHVDAAYGGSFALVDKVLSDDEEEMLSPPFMPIRRTVETIRKGFAIADSTCVDQHKGMFLPFGCGLCLVKDIHALAKSHTVSASYLHNFLNDTNTTAKNKDSGATTNSSPEVATTYSIIHSSDLSPELTRHNRTLRLWIPLQLFGVNAFRCALKEKLLLARYLFLKLRSAAQERRSLQHDSSFPIIRVISPQVSTVAFRVVTALEEEQEESSMDDHLLNAGTDRLESQMRRRGFSFVSSFASATSGRRKIRWLSACVMTFRAHKANVDQLVEEILICCSQYSN